MSYDLSHLLSRHLELCGYQRKDVPIIQPADLFLTRAGDTIIERLFSFERHGRLFALRPEFTSAATRQYALEGHSTSQRWYFSGPIFEDLSDNPFQNQRPSVGAELLNAVGTNADFEIIRAAIGGIELSQLDGWHLVIGHAALQRHLLSKIGLDHHQYRMLLNHRELLKTQGAAAVEAKLREQISAEISSPEAFSAEESDASTQHMLDVLLDSTQYGSTMGSRTREDIAQRILSKRKRSHGLDLLLEGLNVFAKWTALRGKPTDMFAAIGQLLDADDSVGQGYVEDWKQLVDLLVASGIPSERIILQPNLARNWEYYTGIVFGVEVDDVYVAAGGRYDDLATLVNDDATAVPAVGFSYYVDRLLDLLPTAAPTSGIVIQTQRQWISAGQKVTDFLREHDIPTRLAFDRQNTTSDKLLVTVVAENAVQYRNDIFAIDQLESLLNALGS
ncbi:MAG: ATP phosphoribosyltransferase regulatory subunit [Anaerolineaceae bacterium]|nr:ATP phosphoribosyltransferase regulatory subunit [Anaerolineaceae bacterium]